MTELLCPNSQCLFVVKTIAHVMCRIKTFNRVALRESYASGRFRKDPQSGTERKKEVCPHHLCISVGVITGG